MFGLEVGSLILIGVGVTIAFILVYLMVNLYQKCSPNEAMIISGMYAGRDGRSYKIIVGGGAVMLPMVQQKSTLSLEVMTIDVHSQAPMITKNGVPIFC